MRHRYFCFAIQFLMFFGICTVSATAQNLEEAAPLRLDEEMIQMLQEKILKSLQRQTDLLKENLVDIISREETIVYRDQPEQYKGIWVETSKFNIISDYRISFLGDGADTYLDCGTIAKLLNPQEPPYILQEERKLLSEKEPHISLQRARALDALGNFYMDTARNSFAELIVPFDKLYEKCFNYKLLGVVKTNGRNTFVMEVTEKEISNIDKEARLIEGITITLSKTNVSSKTKFEGLALIDAETMEILQFNNKGGEVGVSGDGRSVTDYKVIQRNSVTFQSGNRLVRIETDKGLLSASPEGKVLRSSSATVFWKNYFFVKTEYSKIKIKDQFLTLPAERNVGVFSSLINLETLEFTDETRLIETYATRYGDYRVFDVDAKIIYGTPDEALPDKTNETADMEN